MTNLAAYRFVDLDNLESLRQELRQECERLDLRGTILLSHEGININVAGTADAAKSFKTWIGSFEQFRDLDYKESCSTYAPFRRMLVRLKKEIIAFGVPDVAPAQSTAPRIQAAALKKWLDSAKEVTLLDTRNDYEVRLGTFRGAEHLNISTFREFPRAVERLKDQVEPSRPLVTFCTGGIRCEKAAALLVSSGFPEVYQLDGGILRYFEQVGDEHYEGECFVYDRRVALDGDLAETDTIQCFSCGQPLTTAEQKLPSYIPNVACLYCADGKIAGRAPSANSPPRRS